RLEKDGGDQITKSSVSSIQAASIWATTPNRNKNRSSMLRFFLACTYYLVFETISYGKSASRPTISAID
ncbi:hypothetical protein, partial [Aeromonas enteropelogenes]|uniref:hypothetical protein n=1 Tax=Aeromonas enteropelogenes TaxID=29489 RepID=UPI0038D166F2